MGCVLFSLPEHESESYLYKTPDTDNLECMNAPCCHILVMTCASSGRYCCLLFPSTDKDTQLKQSFTRGEEEREMAVLQHSHSMWRHEKQRLILSKFFEVVFFVFL